MKAGKYFLPVPLLVRETQPKKQEDNMEFYGNPKAFVLVSNDNIYQVIKSELESCGFEVEGLLSAISCCSLIILDHEALRLDIVNYLHEKKIEKPVLLVLKETETYSARIKSHRIFQDILVVRDPEIFESGVAISALEGEHSLRILFERYLPEVHSPVLVKQKPVPVYARLVRPA